MTSQKEKLRELIVQRIRRKGPITFRDFMEMALYHPHLGYYASGTHRIGAAGDYFTSPTVSRLFGELIADWLVRVAGEREETFTVIEMGAERGLLAGDVTTYLKRAHPALASRLEYRALERGSILTDIARGAIISNELIDAFPVHRVRMTPDGLKEIYVSFSEKGFDEELAEPSTPEIAGYFAELGVTLPPGYVTEVNLEAMRFVEKVATALHDGFVLTIDYGFTSEELYVPYRSDGTLLGYHQHRTVDDPYVNIGDQDLTSHVNFSALMRWGEKAGLRTVGFTDQTHFLLEHGYERKLQELESKAQSSRELYKDVLALKQLIMPDGMGGTFKVLVQEKQP